eukprot:scaffold12829_cov116-Isochrysis_galbana.AAC.21
MLQPPTASTQRRIRCATTVHGLRREIGGRMRHPKPQPSRQPTPTSRIDFSPVALAGSAGDARGAPGAPCEPMLFQGGARIVAIISTD